jgi:hypothetical protein
VNRDAAQRHQRAEQQSGSATRAPRPIDHTGVDFHFE